MRFVHPDTAVAHMSRTDWRIMGAGVVVFVGLTFVATLENALAVIATFYVLAIVVQMKWESREDPRLWALIGAVGVVQFPVAFLVYIPPAWAKGICIGLMFLEGFALLGLLTWMERRWPRAGGPGARTGEGDRSGAEQP